MKEFIDKSIAFFKANILISVLIGIGIIMLFFGRQVKKILFGTRRVKHRAGYQSRYRNRINTRWRGAPTRSRRTLPHSVGMHKVRTNKPPVYNKNGSRKKPWQIAGSPAARRHMAEIRKRR